MLEQIPPHNLDAELDVLAACLQSEVVLPAVQALGLTAGDFYRDDHGGLFGALEALAAKGKPVDLSTALASLPPGSPGYILVLDLAGRLATTAATEYMAGLVLDASRRRAAIRACLQSLAELHDPHAEDPASDAAARLMDAAMERGRESVVNFVDLALAVSEEAQAARDRKRAASTIATGLYDLDRMAYIEPGDMIVLGARPSAGKTAFGVQVMAHIARTAPVLFFSLEMSGRAIARRYLTGETGLSAHRQLTGYFHEHEANEHADKAAASGNLLWRVDDRTGLTVAQIAATTRREHIRQGGLGLVVIDHLVKVKAVDARGTGHARLTQVSNDLKNLARQLRVPFLVLAQLNRAADKEERKPRASDLRESGSVEEDADHVWLLHRPERDKPFGPAELDVAKQRNGPCGTIHLTFDAGRTRFAIQERAGVL